MTSLSIYPPGKRESATGVVVKLVTSGAPTGAPVIRTYTTTLQLADLRQEQLYVFIGRPNAAAIASIIASERVGWACIVSTTLAAIPS